MGGDFEVIKRRASHKGMGAFLWGKLATQDFNLAIVGGLGWMKWLKNGAGKCLYFLQLILHCILFGEYFVGSVKVPLYSVCFDTFYTFFLRIPLYSIMEKQNSNQNGKTEKLVVLGKTFDHYYHKFQLF